MEEGEYPAAGAKREAFEELGVTVNIKETFAKIEFHGTQYFFLAEIIEGTFGTGQGEEYTDENRNRGTYFPLWVDIEKFSYYDIKPKEVASKIQSVFN
ncbi:NUDIX domain-containing protein [Virgibacillus halophilus]|uniref:NUDIX domain-containing protein n=1 Tax=Tigheibacillus halophilus TaxID=361280 RepID=UPI0036426D12